MTNPSYYWTFLVINALSNRAALFGLFVLPWMQATAGTQADAEENIEGSVIKIYTTQAQPDYFTPWRLLTPRQSSGSGAVIRDNRILTNAHVVANASYVQAQKHNDPQRYQARVIFISHEADLALITVDEPGFFNDLNALTIGELPKPLQEVSVYGYPIGGKTLSITKGILSRVEQQVYAHAGAYLLAGQIDAAINPGNSGGPVIVDNSIVGVVMQANAGGRAENLGYFVPPDIVNHVLKDSQDGTLDGFPDLGFRTQTLDSPSARAAYGLEKNENGVLVIKVFEDSPADGVIQENDVIMRIDEYDIADDGTIQITPDVLTNYKHAIDMHHLQDQIELTFSRDGEITQTSLSAMQSRPNYSLVRGERFDETPQYYIYGGILFVPLNMNLIKRWGNDWGRTAPVSLLQARNEWASPTRRELIVALQVLAADVNLGYHDWRNWIVDSVNGEEIVDFDHFAQKLRANTEENIVFKNKNGYQMVINREEAIATEKTILGQYRIPAAYSQGLFD
ncbi:MAG TPA: protease [Gammaproteobacteria bacterium]|nr:protease [Gammaproteobacteria bacterium]|tara:strand:+ start:17092 stop:18618 length:1527 start_codon:yes stop_codon:yes gene_type:complete